MEFMNPALWNGVSVVTVVLVGTCAYVRALTKGTIVTEREHEATVKRAEKAEETRDSLIAQNSELMEMARLGQATFTALRKGAEK